MKEELETDGGVKVSFSVSTQMRTHVGGLMLLPTVGRGGGLHGCWSRIKAFLLVQNNAWPHTAGTG